MTIKGLGGWLSGQTQIKSEILAPAKILGKRIPIDILGIMYQYRFGPRKTAFRNINPFTTDPDELEVDRQWFSMLIKKLVCWIRYLKIIPVFVFDGTPRPLKIQKELQRRKDKQSHVETRMTALRLEYANTRSLKIPESAKLELRKLRAAYKLVPRESASRFKKFFTDLGVPTITVSGDAERFCALYSAENRVPAMSRDRDCFAFGAHSIIVDETDYKSPDSPIGQWAFQIIRTNQLLAAVGVDYDNFVDLCIFAGTDYNDNIKGLSFGKGIPLIKKHKYLENFPIDLTELNYLEVRKEFQQVPAKSLITHGSLDIDVNMSSMQAALTEYNCTEWQIELTKVMEILIDYPKIY